MNSFKLAYLHIIRNKFTTIFCIISIAISVATAGTLYRLFLASEKRFLSLTENADVLIGAKSGALEILLDALNGEGSNSEFPDLIPFALYEPLKENKKIFFEDGSQVSTEFIKSIVPVLYFSTYKEAKIIATKELFFDSKNNKIDKKDLLLEGRLASNSFELAVGYNFAVENKIKIGQEIELETYLNNKNLNSKNTFKVVGLFKKTYSFWDYNAFIDIDSAYAIQEKNISEEAKTKNWKSVHYLFIKSEDKDFLKIKNFINKKTVAQAVLVSDEKLKLKKLTQSGEGFALIVTGLILLLGCFSVVAMLSTRFDGMKSQLALLRALGFRKIDLYKWLFYESVLLVVPSILIGALADQFFFETLYKSISLFSEVKANIELSIFESSRIWIIVLIATIFVGIIPIINFQQDDVHKTLR